MPLTLGLKYVVVIVATNTGGPPLDVSGATLPVLVDASPPKPKFVRLVALDPGASPELADSLCNEALSAAMTMTPFDGRVDPGRRIFRLCWQPFDEPESTIVEYEFHIHDRDEHHLDHGGIYDDAFTSAGLRTGVTSDAFDVRQGSGVIENKHSTDVESTNRVRASV